MPELPEVETIRRQLEKRVVGHSIIGVDLYPGAMTIPRGRRFSTDLKGRQIAGISRRGKYFIFNLAAGHRLVAHLKMSGAFLIGEDASPPRTYHYIRCRFRLSDGSQLLFTDIRRLGRLWFDRPGEDHAGIENLGLDPFDPQLTPRWLQGELRRRRLDLKTFLMNQTIIAGIGNIYASEILFGCHIHPQEKSYRLSINQATVLIKEMKRVLRTAIAHCGTTFSRYRDANGAWGGFRRFLKVYDRDGKPCRRCRTTIKRIVQGGRSSFFCPHCQMR